MGINLLGDWKDSGEYISDFGTLVKRDIMWEITGKFKYMQMFSNIPDKTGNRCILHKDSVKYNRLLELGCDWGHCFPIFPNIAVNYFGIDNANISEINVKKYGYESRFIKGDIDFLPFKDLSFDIICSSHVLEHAKDIRKLMSELNRITVIGGYSLHNIPAIMSWTHQEGHNNFHFNSMNYKEWIRTFYKFGFDVVGSYFGWAGNQEDFTIISQKVIRYEYQ